jgi:hypothetical protein
VTLPAHLDTALAVLGELDVASLASPGEIERHVRLVATVRSWTDAVLTALAARADELAASCDGGGPGGEHLVRSAARLSHHAAAAVARRTAVAGRFPLFAAALAAGSVTGEHLDALGRVLRGLEPAVSAAFVAAEDDLLGSARRLSPEAFGRAARELAEFLDPDHAANEFEHLEQQASMRMWRGRDGLHHFAGTFGPTTGAAAAKAVQHETDRLAAAEATRPETERPTGDQLRVEALTNLINGGHAQRHPGRSTLAVHVGLERFLGEPGGDQTCETSGGVQMPIDWVRTMAMRADIIPVVLDRAGQAVELARTATSRLATFLQRVMLRAMHTTCIVPGCEVPFDDCQIHHLEPANGRNTVLANLAPICPADHRRVHRDGWHLHLDEQRDVTIRLRDGTLLAREPFRPPGARPRAAAA